MAGRVARARGQCIGSHRGRGHLGMGGPRHSHGLVVDMSPDRPPRMCAKCRATFTGPRCPCRKAWEGSAWKGQGSTRAWRRRRARQLEEHPICQAPGCNLLATQVDHVYGKAKGDHGPIQSLCKDHHEAKTKEEARRGRQGLPYMRSPGD